MYTACYLDAALVTRIQFSSNNADNAGISKRKKGINIANGILYCLLVVGLVTNLLIKNDENLGVTLLSCGLSTCIAFALIYSMPKLLDLLKALNQGMHRKTLMSQLVILGLIASLDVVFVFLKFKYIIDCEDHEIVWHWAPMTATAFQSIENMLWRLITATMCIFFIEQATKVKSVVELVNI